MGFSSKELPVDYPRFVLNRSRFDQSTFQGRLRHFLDIVDPRTLLTSELQLRAAVDLLEHFKNRTLPPGVSNRELWEAQKIKQSILHPDTGEKIFMPFRMSGYVPFGSVTVIGLLLPNPTFGQTIFWQWLNQSHNACVNYSNRNATKVCTLRLVQEDELVTCMLNLEHMLQEVTPTRRFVIGYIGAVTSAVGIAVGLNLLIRRANRFSAATKLFVKRFVPFPAVAMANICNVALMRNNELTEGIDVFDATERVVGTSKVAARKALEETALTRIFLPAPIFLIPPLLMSFIEKMKFMKTYPRMHLPVNAVVCTACFAVSLPIAIALFPQISEISTHKLEEPIRTETKDSVLFYNKGL